MPTNSNRMFDLIEPFIQEVQDLETVMNDLREVRDVDNGEGVQLDGIGDIVDLPRNGVTDDNIYRASLKLKNTLNIASGQPEMLIAFANDFSGGTTEYREPWPGFFQMFFDDNLEQAQSLRERLDVLAPVGVGFDLIFVDADLPVFNFANEGGFSSPGSGFLELDYPEAEHSYTAGCFSELIQ